MMMFYLFVHDWKDLGTERTHSTHSTQLRLKHTTPPYYKQRKTIVSSPLFIGAIIRTKTKKIGVFPSRDMLIEMLKHGVSRKTTTTTTTTTTIEIRTLATNTVVVIR